MSRAGTPLPARAVADPAALPELAELVALRGAARGLSLHARRPALACLAGSHRSVHRGLGLEFEEVRAYAAGDDPRSIDWRVTARRGRPHTKLFREERERPVWLVADLHPGLFFGSRRQLKSALLLRAAALLAWVAAQGGDRLGAVIGGAGMAAPGRLATAPRAGGSGELAKPGWAPADVVDGGSPKPPLSQRSRGDPATAAPASLFAPRTREAGVLPVLGALVEAQPRAPGAPGAGALGALLLALRPLLQPGSLVVVLSDFASLDEADASALAAFAGRSECWLLQVADPLEIAGLPAGRFRAGLPGRLWLLDGDRVRAPWQAAWAAREARLTEFARRFALPLTRLMTADAVEEALPPLLRDPAWAA